MELLGNYRRKATPFIAKWGKLIGVTGGAQLLIQGTGFVCGIFIIHILSTEQYAYYTLANTMLGTMTVLADGGISTGVMSEGGNNWKDRKALGEILATGMQMRRQFAVGSLLISLPILFFLLQKQGMVWWQAVLLISCLAPAFWAALSGSLLQIVPKLHQNIDQLLKVNVSVNIARLLVTVPLLLLSPIASLAILAAGISQVGGNLQFRKLSFQNADWKQAASPVFRKRILATVKRILPGSIYYCLSGQITVWLVSIFNTTEGIAQIGALARLMMLLTLIRLSIDMLIVPRYARLPMERKLIITRFFQVLLIVAIIAAALIGAVYLFPKVFLFVLGKKYMGLEYEVFLMTISSCLVMISGICHVMTSSRRIIPHPFWFIATILGGQALFLAFIVDYTSVAGIIHFSILTAFLTVSYRIIHFIRLTFIEKNWIKLTSD